MTELTIEQKVQALADGLGISLYITQDGRVMQNGPGREIRPRDSAKPSLAHGCEMPKDKPAE